MDRDGTGARKVDPYRLLYQGGRFYLSGTATSGGAGAPPPLVASAARAPSRARPSTTSSRPNDFDPRPFANRADWQFGDATPPPRSASPSASPGRSSTTSAATARSALPTRATARSSSAPRTPRRAQLASWVLRLGEHARVLGPPALRDVVDERIDAASRAATTAAAPRWRPWSSDPAPPTGHVPVVEDSAKRETAIRPERFARLVTLASILIRRRTRAVTRLAVADVLRAPADLRRRSCSEDVNVLNVVNFGGGSYVLYAEIHRRRDDRGRPRAVLRQLRPARPACCRSRPRRSSPRSTSSGTTCRRAR